MDATKLLLGGTLLGMYKQASSLSEVLYLWIDRQTNAAYGADKPPTYKCREIKDAGKRPMFIYMRQTK
ncbi:MAG: hypothetical protein LUC49_00975 [Prevotella sp.]|nr:hypothetical protein [Prevotella sp.]